MNTRKFDIGICSVEHKKKRYNEGCEWFKLNQLAGGKPYMVCLNCMNWQGTWMLEQTNL